jgi:hypothetical protein
MSRLFRPRQSASPIYINLLRELDSFEDNDDNPTSPQTTRSTLSASTPTATQAATTTVRPSEAATITSILSGQHTASASIRLVTTTVLSTLPAQTHTVFATSTLAPQTVTIVAEQPTSLNYASSPTTFLSLTAQSDASVSAQSNTATVVAGAKTGHIILGSGTIVLILLGALGTSLICYLVTQPAKYIHSSSSNTRGKCVYHFSENETEKGRYPQ